MLKVILINIIERCLQGTKHRERFSGSGKGLGAVLSPVLATREQDRCDKMRKDMDLRGDRAFDGRKCEMCVVFNPCSNIHCSHSLFLTP